MKKLYEKDELLFAILWIVIYCLVESIGGSLSRSIGIESFFTALFNLIMTVYLFFWIKGNKLFVKYGLCLTTIPARQFLWYIPLLIISTSNLWLGFKINMSLLDTTCYVCSMICVGFLEEIIFRGLLFKALSKEGIKKAIVISSVTFGLGHFLNLINGSGMMLIENLCQVVGAIAIGFLFVLIVYRGQSLWPCIITHGAINTISAFANETSITTERLVLFCIIRVVIVFIYIILLYQTLPQKYLQE